MTGNFHEIALLLAAAGIGTLAIRLRQPLILAYIAVGILAGSMILGWITARDPLDLLAQVGVAVLLFTVGLKLNLHLVRRLGAVALATGLEQLFFTILFGYLLDIALGMDHLKAIYVAVALTFFSTTIIVKSLSDKNELGSLHGRIAVGFLIVQGIAVVEDAHELKKSGAELIFHPYFDAAEYAAGKLQQTLRESEAPT